MSDISMIADADEILDRIETGRERRFTEQERYEVTRFAFKSDSPELTECLVMEMAYSLHNTKPVIARYKLLLDECGDGTDKITDILVLLEMLRIKRMKAINALRSLLHEFGLDVVETENRTDRAGSHEPSL